VILKAKNIRKVCIKEETMYTSGNIEAIFKVLSMRNRRKRQAEAGAVSQASKKGERCAGIGREEAL
jgi:hypothetical protein